VADEWLVHELERVCRVPDVGAGALHGEQSSVDGRAAARRRAADVLAHPRTDDALCTRDLRGADRQRYRDRTRRGETPHRPPHRASVASASRASEWPGGGSAHSAKMGVRPGARSGNLLGGRLVAAGVGRGAVWESGARRISPPGATGNQETLTPAD